MNSRKFNIAIHKEMVRTLCQNYLNSRKLKNSITITSIRISPKGTVVASCVELGEV